MVGKLWVFFGGNIFLKNTIWLLNFFLRNIALLVQSELGVLWGEIHFGNIDRSGMQMRTGSPLRASCCRPAPLIAASDVRRHMTLQVVGPTGRGGQFPAGRNLWREEEGQVGVCQAGRVWRSCFEGRRALLSSFCYGFSLVRLYF